MPTELAIYFAAEKQGGFLLVAMAVASFALAAFLWSTRNVFLAMAWPLLILGAAELAIGLTIALRTDGQVAALEHGLGSSRAETLPAEIQRMDKVNRSFRMIKIAEVIVIAIGLLVVVAMPHPGTWAAVGLGLLLEAAALLVFDVFAHQRALVYMEWLRQLGA